MINLVSFKSSPSLGSSYIDELFDSLGELILEMRYDVKELENQTTENIKKTHFNIFLKSQYKIIKESSPSISDSKKISNKSFSINFYLQKKSESSFSQQVESWNFYLIHAKKEQEDLISQLSSFSRAKICIFFRSILCFLTTLPLWSNYIILNETNLNKKDYFLDHELLLNSKEKNPYDIDQMNYKEKYIDVETENFFLIFKISYLADFSFLSNGNCFIHKLKQKQFNYQKIKRERFLSEGTSEENQQNEKGEGAPLRFFAQWGIEEDISKRKVPNHFKIQPKLKNDKYIKKLTFFIFLLELFV